VDALPIDAVLPHLRETLAAHRSLVLQAPPGAGKSTGVPLALLNEPWLRKRKIVMLEPRRLAARAVATRMASQLNEAVGRTVGYRTRLDTKVSRDTRIEVVTEGVLTRWLQNDAALEDIALVIFDEFHERSLQADLGLALCLEIQDSLRDDLKLLVMSATLDGDAVAKLLGDAPIVTADGRAFPVDVHYRTTTRPQRGYDDVVRNVISTTLNAIEQHEGDVLVFLPGQGEIHRAQRLLEEAGLPKSTLILPLYGELPPDDQDKAIRPSQAGQRKIVLTTNIAETSLTIEGVRIVIDAGLARQSLFDPVTGMSRLETVRISRAAADQRRGRAGRLSAGVCYRLWSETEHQSLAVQTSAEILQSDLAPLALELAMWGCRDVNTMRLLDRPPAATFAQARDLLQRLQAIDANGVVTAHGRAMAELGMHPRLAHMLLQSHRSQHTRLACELAALLGERDLLRPRSHGSNAARDVDMRRRIDALHSATDMHGEFDVDRGVRQRVLRSADLYMARMKSRDVSLGTTTVSNDDAVGLLLAYSFPDRIARVRGNGRYLLSNGRGAMLMDAQSLTQANYLVVAELDDADRDARIRLAAPIDLELLLANFSDQIIESQEIVWDSQQNCVQAREQRCLGSVVLQEKRLEKPNIEAVRAAMLQGIRELGIASLPWHEEERELQARMEFVRRIDTTAPESWPAVDDVSLLSNLDTWLAPWLDGISRRDHLNRLKMEECLHALLTWNQRVRLDELAPTHLHVPSGSNIRIDYSASPPTLSVRLQEVFGLTETPRVGGGKVAVLMQLLSPARRPVQTTQDLASFWARGYHDVKKDLKGRYPKHYWPDDPLQAEATARAKPRGQ
jgi:ATP-dependent helicase HrpB